MSRILNYCSSSQNLGGFRRIRIAESKLIYQQEFQTETELDEIQFWGGENWTAQWELYDDFQTEFKIETASGDSWEDKYSLKINLEVDLSPNEFRKFFREQIQNRRFAVEMTNINGFVRCINPFFITYNYIAEVAYSKKNRFELIFTKTKMLTYAIPTISDEMLVSQTCELEDEMVITQTCELDDEIIITQTCDIQPEFTASVTYF